MLSFGAPIGRRAAYLKSVLGAATLQRGVQPHPAAAGNRGIAVVAALRALVAGQIDGAAIRQRQHLVTEVRVRIGAVELGVLVEAVVDASGKCGRRTELRGLDAAWRIIHAHGWNSKCPQGRRTYCRPPAWYRSVSCRLRLHRRRCHTDGSSGPVRHCPRRSRSPVVSRGFAPGCSLHRNAWWHC